MSEPKLSARLVLTTVANPEEAARMARILVEERLAACVQIVPGTLSIFHWKGAVEESVEALLLVKTGPEQLKALEVRLHELHSYDTPEFLVLEVGSGSARYLDWLHTSLEPACGLRDKSMG